MTCHREAASSMRVHVQISGADGADLTVMLTDAL